MIIGVLKETRKNEARAALSLDTAKKIIALKHELIIEEGAGLASFINDADYASVGVKVVDRKEVFNATPNLNGKCYARNRFSVPKTESCFSRYVRAV